MTVTSAISPSINPSASHWVIVIVLCCLVYCQFYKRGSNGGSQGFHLICV